MKWEIIQSFQVTENWPVTAITEIPNSNDFFTGDESGNIVVWEKFYCLQIDVIKTHKSTIHSLVYSENLHELISSAYEASVCT
jgi:hypothetical protein